MTRTPLCNSPSHLDGTRCQLRDGHVGPHRMGEAQLCEAMTANDRRCGHVAKWSTPEGYLCGTHCGRRQVRR